MTKGLTYDPHTHELQIVNGSRQVMIAAGVMVSLLTTLETFTGQTATFPDFQKGNLYIWTSAAKVAISTLGRGESAFSYITAKAEEYSSVTSLMDAPDGADFFWGQLKLSRTTAPANTWMGRTLAVLPIASQWMQIPGAFSCLLEAEVDMARALHVYIDDDPLSATYRKLVMEVEQSVGPAIGGYITDTRFSDGVNYNEAYEAVNGSDTATGSANGIPISLRGQASYGYENSAWGGGPLIGSSIPPTDLRHNGSGHTGAAKPSRVDNTNYQSVYSVDIRGRFGRRS